MIEFFPERTVLITPADQSRKRELTWGSSLRAPSAQRAPNVLLIPGTSAVAHLRDNVAGAALTLCGDDLAELNKIGS